MRVEALQKYKPLARPILFSLVIAIHVIALICIKFSVSSAAQEEEKVAEIFKLVDVEEFVPPPPPPVIEKKEVVIPVAKKKIQSEKKDDNNLEDNK